MTRTVTVVRPRILMGFMLDFALRLEGEQRLLTNGSTVRFTVSAEEHLLEIRAENNPNVTGLAPLTIPAGEEDVAVRLCVVNDRGRPRWYLELQ